MILLMTAHLPKPSCPGTRHMWLLTIGAASKPCPASGAQRETGAQGSSGMLQIWPPPPKQWPKHPMTSTTGALALRHQGKTACLSRHFCSTLSACASRFHPCPVIPSSCRTSWNCPSWNCLQPGILNCRYLYRKDPSIAAYDMS